MSYNRRNTKYPIVNIVTVEEQEFATDYFIDAIQNQENLLEAGKELHESMEMPLKEVRAALKIAKVRTK